MERGFINRLDREELSSELEFRGLSNVESFTVDQLRKKLRQCLKLEDQGVHFDSKKLHVRQDPVKYADWKVENGRLFKHQATEFDTSNPWKLVIPKADRGQILHESHDLLTSGHQGEARTYFRVNERYYWPKMRADCKRYVQKCRVCQQSKSPPTKPHGLLSGLHLPTRPWEIIATDLIGPLPRTSKGHRYICLITDVFSKYVVIKPIRNAKSKTVSDVVEIEIFLTYGVPSIILCDNGPEYRGAPFRSLADSYGVKIFFNARRHPQANPAERYNRTLIGMLRAYIRDDHRRWDGLLPKLAVALRTSTNHTTGFSPASLVFSFGYQMDPTHVRVSQESPCPDPHFLRCSGRRVRCLSLYNRFIVEWRIPGLKTKRRMTCAGRL
ncbi:Hypothetical protein NTJ_10051 [Nesidiocoris tenuis]|uniref:RNA-directed DNA polymerase n=1 Tax=Nesidiocoris tenuis TaxID=355587 RepID=A0ABN7B3B5_9HEMI|nr:Hypothetical protein NTJ_10051 [Nesidiocoris tenuis]